MFPCFAWFHDFQYAELAGDISRWLVGLSTSLARILLCKMYFQFLQNVFPIFAKVFPTFRTLHPFFAKCISNMMSWTNHDDWSGCFYAKCILQLLQRNFQFFAKWTSIVCKMCFQYAELDKSRWLVGLSTSLVRINFSCANPDFYPWKMVGRSQKMSHNCTSYDLEHWN